MSFYVYAWIASIMAGVATIVGKLTAKHSLKNLWLFNFLWSFATLIFIIPIAIVNGVGLPNKWLDIILVAFFGSIFYITYTLTIYKFDVSAFAPLFNLRTGFVVLLGVFFANETLTLHQLGLIILMMVAGVLVTLDEKFNPKKFFQKSILIVFICMAAVSFQNLFIKKAMIVNGYWEVVLWSLVLTQLILLLTLPWFYKDIKKISLKQVSSLGLMGLCDVVVNLGSMAAYKQNISISSAIMNIPFSLILAFLFSIFAPSLLEKHSLKIYVLRFLATGIMIAAGLKLTA